jgi:DNA-binding response OmpR family regulator
MENRRRVLVAQSDTKSALQLRSMLLEHGWDVLIANDALQAFSIAIREKPVAVLASSELAGGGGVSLLKRIRNSVHTTRTAVIAIGRDGKSKKEFLQAGAAEFMEQPLSSESLNMAVRRHVERPNVWPETQEKTIQASAGLASPDDSNLSAADQNAAFDDLTHLASKLLDAPTALLCVVDRERQFCMSQMGLADPGLGFRHPTLAYSFCQLVACGRDESVVEDARQHGGLLASLGFRDLGIIAYAGAAVTSRGEVIGSFCAMDWKPHKWTEADIDTLRDLCKVAESYTEFAEKRLHEAGAKTKNGNRMQRPRPHCIDTAVASATRILERGGKRIEEPERALLLGIAQRFNEHLARSAAANS